MHSTAYVSTSCVFCATVGKNKAGTECRRVTQGLLGVLHACRGWHREKRWSGETQGGADGVEPAERLKPGYIQPWGERRFDGSGLLVANIHGDLPESWDQLIGAKELHRETRKTGERGQRSVTASERPNDPTTESLQQV